MLQAAAHTQTLLIAYVPWLVARTMMMSGSRVLLVNRSIALPETSEIYRPVLEFLERNRHIVQEGPYVILDEDMASKYAVYTIYRLAVP